MTQHSSSRIAETDDGPLVTAARSTEQAVSRMASQGQKKFTDALEGSRGYITENPLRTVLVAAGVGALLGYMIGRRR